MYTKKIFRIKDMARWTRYETFIFLGYSILLTSIYYVFNLHWLSIPWAPVALIGTAVAFVIGFQNNSAYDRIWEARKIWGGIVNTSRTLGMYLQDTVTQEYATETHDPELLKKEIKTLTYRHIAWMTALRHAMRVTKPWETVIHEKANKEWREMIKPPEHTSTLEDDLKGYISDADLQYILSKSNKQTALLYLQSHHLRRLKEKGLVWEFSFLELESIIKTLFDLQGKSERIKNFPYPRQYATLNHYFMWVFILVLPFAIIPQFAEIGLKINESIAFGAYFQWLAIPFYVAVAWIFHTMERIGRTGENPFEGLANDVPISTIARGIEIDLRENLGENKADIPKQFPEIYDVQM